MRTLHVGLRVTDLDRSIAFYTDLGYEVVGEVPETGLGELVMLKLSGDEFVSIELVHDGGPVDAGGLSHLVINVPALHDVVAHLATRGIDSAPPSSPDGSAGFWTTVITDPDGYRIELVQWPDGHPAGMTRADLTGAGTDREDG